MKLVLPVFPSLLVLAFLAASACATRPLTFNDNTIVPGERVGEVQIGMPLSTLLAVKGTPVSTVVIPGTNATTYAFPGMTVTADDHVYWIVASDPKFHTVGGVAPGVEQIAARGALGEPACVVSKGDTTIYDYRKMYFEVENATGKVTQLGVMARTQNCR